MRRRKFMLVICLFYVLAVIVSSCFTSRINDDEMYNYFANSGYPPKRHFYEAIGRQLHYVETGDSLRQPVLFVHGSPGSWDNFKAF